MKHLYFFAVLILGLIILAVLNFGKQQTYQLFFYNETIDKNLNNGSIQCDPQSVVPVTRTTSNTPSVEEILKLLINGGPLPEEQVQGFSSEFPHQGFHIINMDFKDGILNITFNELPGFTSGGSCRVSLLRYQIEKTALQFPEIKEVNILPENIFQP